MGKQVTHIDWGINSALTYFGIVVMPNISAFEQSPTTQNAMNVVQSLWNLHEWFWYDNYPGQNPVDNENKTTYEVFRKQLIDECPEFSYIRDLAEAAKHCGLGRKSVRVKAIIPRVGRHGVGGYGESSGGYGVGSFVYASGTSQLMVEFDDKSEPLWLEGVADLVKKYWHKKLNFDRATVK